MKSTKSAILNFLFGPKIDKEKILTVHEDNIETLLNKLGMLEKLQNGNLSCNYCGEKLSKENLECIFNKDGTLGFCCDKLDCYLNALQMINKQTGE